MTVEPDALVGVVRAHGGRVLAVLARALGDLQDAEDAMQDAAVAALEVWPRTGVPANPAGWLYTAARRKALDQRRAAERRHRREHLHHHIDPSGRAGGGDADPAIDDAAIDDPPPTLPGSTQVDDDQLRLLLTVCHPALALDAQVALALRLVAGLSVTEIAHALLISESATARRLSRAKQKIRAAAIGRSLPAPTDLPARIAGVLGVIHLLYTTGHAAPDGDLLRDDLCDQALHLARLADRLFPADPSVQGLLALLLLTDARRTTRLEPDGTPALLADQDRSRWDRTAITEGLALLDRSLVSTAGLADPYQLQAAIAAVHATAPSLERTDWSEIDRLYRILHDVHPSTAVLVNHAVVVAEVRGPAAGLDRLAQVPPDRRNHRWHLANGELLAALGAHDAAADALATAALAAGSPGERTRIERRRTAITQIDRDGQG